MNDEHKQWLLPGDRFFSVFPRIIKRLENSFRTIRQQINVMMKEPFIIILALMALLIEAQRPLGLGKPRCLKIMANSCTKAINDTEWPCAKKERGFYPVPCNDLIRNDVENNAHRLRCPCDETDEVVSSKFAVRCLFTYGSVAKHKQTAE